MELYVVTDTDSVESSLRRSCPSYSATTRLGFMPTFTHLLYLHFLHLYIWVKESHVSILLIHVYLVGSRPPLCLLCACRKKLRHQRQATAPYSYHPNPCLP